MNSWTKFAMGHRRISLASNMIFVMFGLRQFHSWSRGFMRFHYATITLFSEPFEMLWGSPQFPVVVSAKCISFLQGMAGFHWYFQLFFLAFLVISLYSSSLGSVIHSSILVFLDSGLLFQFWTIPQATHDLVSLSFELLSVSPRTTFFPWVVFLLIMWILWNLSMSLTNFCSNRRSNNRQHVPPAWRPNQYA